MAFSLVTYTGNGATTQYAVPFPYISASHVSVTVGGVPAAFTWVNAGLIQITVTPPNGSAIVISRSSNQSAPLVTYVVPGLKEEDLNLANLQAIFMAQEAIDSVSGISGSAADVAIYDEGSGLTASVDSINFVGAGVTAGASGGNVTVTIPGGVAGTPGSLWYYGAGAPSAGLGVNADFYLNTSTGGAYSKESGTWTLVVVLKGSDGAAGSNGANGLNGAAWFNGSGAPSAGTGTNGDYYLNTTNGDVYTKSGGAWGSPVGNIRGPAGTNGTNGTNGQGVPVGGTTGQVLAKVDATDFNTQWVAPSGGSALTVKDEGSNLTTSATSIDFVGAGVTATNTGGAVTATIPGGAYPAGSGAEIQYRSGATAFAAAANWSISGGNLNGATSALITADFSSATHSNRAMFQSNVSNGSTLVGARPNGTSTLAEFKLYNNSTPTNSGVLTVGMGTSLGYIDSGISGSGTARPLELRTSGTSRMSIAASSYAFSFPGASTSFDFAGTGVRFKADTVNATVANRWCFQDRNAGTTSFNVIGGTTNADASFSLLAGNDPNNAPFWNGACSGGGTPLAYTNTGATGTANVPSFEIRTNATARMKFETTADVSVTANLYPGATNTYSCGKSGALWTAVWATNGTIQTSDARMKTDIEDIPSETAVALVKAMRPVSYRWKIGGYTDGVAVPGKRQHSGFLAQEMRKALEETGAASAAWIKGDLNDEESEEGINYGELIAPMAKALQAALNEIEALKARLAAAGIA